MRACVRASARARVCVSFAVCVCVCVSVGVSKYQRFGCQLQTHDAAGTVVGHAAKRADKVYV